MSEKCYGMEFLEKNNIGFYTDLKRFDDLPFKVETFAYAKSVVMIPEYLYYYRLEREGQQMMSGYMFILIYLNI